MDLAGSERVAVRGGDPGVEDLVTGPDGDHHRLIAGAGWLADQFGEDAVLLADGAALGDPRQIPLAPLRRDYHSPQADDHGDSSEDAVIAAPGGRAGVCEVRPRWRAQPHSVRSYPALTAPATTSGAPRASCCTSPATSGPIGRTV
jgi:hypothetical protein